MITTVSLSFTLALTMALALALALTLTLTLILTPTLLALQFSTYEATKEWSLALLGRKFPQL